MRLETELLMKEQREKIPVKINQKVSMEIFLDSYYRIWGQIIDRIQWKIKSEEYPNLE